MSERRATLSKLEKVPQDPPPAEESVRQTVSSATACENPRHRNRRVRWPDEMIGTMHVSWQRSGIRDCSYAKESMSQTVSSTTACKILRHRNEAMRCMM